MSNNDFIIEFDINTDTNEELKRAIGALDTTAGGLADAVADKEIDDIIAILDGQVGKEVSRIKINVAEGDDVAAGEYKREYHHGRCDVGSPWARGCSFDVLE